MLNSIYYVLVWTQTHNTQIHMKIIIKAYNNTILPTASCSEALMIRMCCRKSTENFFWVRSLSTFLKNSFRQQEVCKIHCQTFLVTFCKCHLRRRVAAETMGHDKTGSEILHDGVVERVSINSYTSFKLKKTTWLTGISYHGSLYFNFALSLCKWCLRCRNHCYWLYV